VRQTVEFQMSEVKISFITHLIQVFESPPLELFKKMFVFAEDHLSDWKNDIQSKEKKSFECYVAHRFVDRVKNLSLCWQKMNNDKILSPFLEMFFKIVWIKEFQKLFFWNNVILQITKVYVDPNPILFVSNFCFKWPHKNVVRSIFLKWPWLSYLFHTANHHL